MITISERPVLRDPKSGLLDRHSAYEGWVPREPARLSAYGYAFTVLAMLMLAWVLK